MKPKDRVTIADVARKARVSTMTVSRVLNNKVGISEQTRAHVLRVMQELGYRPNRVARSLVTDRTLKIGAVVPSISSAYFGAILEGAERVFWETEYHMLLCNTGGNPRRESIVYQMFEEDRVDGVLVFSSYLSCDELSTCLRSQRAAVVINSDVDPDIAGHIVVDEHGAMHLAVSHLVASGRERLGFVCNGTMTYAMRGRWDGFIASVQAHQLPVNPDYMTVIDREDHIQGIMTWLEQNPQINGIVCFNDIIAAWVMKACANIGRAVPEDIAIVGYDDIYLADIVNPTLTTLRLSMSKKELGAMAARMLLERIEGQAEQPPVMLSHKMVLRDSAPGAVLVKGDYTGETLK